MKNTPLPIRFVNLTPHVITDVESGRAFPPSGAVARVTSTTEPLIAVDGVQLYETHYGDVEGLPDPEAGVYLIVSGMVKGALYERTDVISPGALVRDAAGNPIGCKGFNS